MLRKWITTLFCGVLALAFTATAVAQDVQIEEVVVTGSYIKRLSQEDSISPITNLGREEINATGILTGQELVRWLPSNTGSENQADALTQGGTPGTANINLRGLGLGSTLVLINGRRQTVSSATANGGDTFVDINSIMPMIMLQNIEILKDGAAALYGSDAVAGVANYKTRDNFEGFEIRGDYQATEDSDDHDDQEISLLFGTGNDQSSIVAGFSYFKRDELQLLDRDLPRKTTSTFGNPGSYVVLGTPLAGSPPAAPVPGFTPDPNCLDATGTGILPLGGDAGLCLFDFGPSYSLVPEETRTQFYTVMEHDVSDYLALRGEFGYTKLDIQGGYSPSFPNLSFPVIAGDHPGNPWGAPVVGRFRVFGDGLGAPGSGRVLNTADHETFRYVLAGSGSMGFSNWTYDASYTRSRNDLNTTAGDQSLSRLNLALAGFGGRSCDVLNGTAGVGDCLYYNPFANALIASPGDAEYNTPEVLAYVDSVNPTDYRSELNVWDLIFTGDLFDLPAGTVGMAVGYQRREEKRKQDNSDDANAKDLVFLIGDFDSNASRDVDAYFAEVLVPVFDNDVGTLEAQLAVRYEDYTSGFDSTDPKFGLLFQRGEWLSLRGTWGTSFRAPTLFQQNVSDTSLNQTSDAITGGGATFLGWTASPNPELQPEDATTYNLGFTVSPLDNLMISLDYYNTEYKDRIVQQSGQDLIQAENDALAGAGCVLADIQALTADPACEALLNPQVIRDPVLGVPLRINVNRFNASRLETDGFDLELSYFLDTNYGQFSFVNNTTYVNSFDLDAGDGTGTVTGAGRRNEANALANPVPKLRSNTVVGWSLGAFSANFIPRYIDDYREANGNTVEHWWVFDLNATYRFNVFGDSEAEVTVGGMNIFDEDPPEVGGSSNEFGYDTKTHDPRGRMLFARFIYQI